MRLGVRRVDPTLPLPAYATLGAVGLDLYCRLTTTVEPQAIGMIPANLIVAVPDGYMLLVTLRSSTPRRTGLIAPHGVGVIDQDYCGPDDELTIQVYNLAADAVTVVRGDRIAQAILVPTERIEWDEQAALSAVSRGGFGSTDR